MNVNLGETFDQFIEKLIKSGLYQSQSEIVREGLRLLKEREDMRALRFAQLRREIDRGLNDLEAGNQSIHDESSLREMFKESKANGRRKLKAKGARGE